MRQIKQTYLILLIVISLFSLAIYSTYAMFTTEINTNNIVSIDTSLSIDTNIDEYQIVTIASNSYKTLTLSINNFQAEDLYYGVWYEIIGQKTNDVKIYKLETSLSPTLDIIKVQEKKNVSIAIINDTNKKVTIKLGIASSKTSSLNLSAERNLIIDQIADTAIRNKNATEYLKNLYTEENTELYYDEENNLIFYGEVPHNYVLFNQELWQIIGSYNNQIKLIKEESIGEYIYNNESQDLENSQIISLLNNLYYKSTTGLCYKNSIEEECNFTKNGIATINLEKIANQAIKNEITSINNDEELLTKTIMYDTTFQANISLLSLNDYKKTLNCQETCHKSWLIEHDTMLATQNINDNSLNIFSITNHTLTKDNLINAQLAVRPVILLKENISIITGSGTKESPYILK